MIDHRSVLARLVADLHRVRNVVNDAITASEDSGGDPAADRFASVAGQIDRLLADAQHVCDVELEP